MAAKKGKNGEAPGWVKRLQIWAFSTMWNMHDSIFSPIFGPGDTSPEKQDAFEHSLMEKC
jgi:hypothetical protein